MKRSLAFLLVAAVPSSAGELCVSNFSSYFPCPGDDIAWIVEHVGFNSSGPPCAGGPEETYYRVTLSASPSDPDVNSGPLPADLTLYLWNTPFPWASASAGDGWGNLSLEITGDLQIDTYQPIAAGLHLWDAPSRSLTFGTCAHTAPTLIGAFVLASATSTEWRFESRSWGSAKSLHRQGPPPR